MILMNGLDVVAEAEGEIVYDDHEKAWRVGSLLIVDVDKAFVVVAPAERVITKLKYMDRFTDVELAGIYTAAKSSVAVEVWLEKFKIASEINLDDPAHPAGLAAMVSAGLLGPARPAEILA